MIPIPCPRLILSIGLALCASLASAQDFRPNFLVIAIDDLNDYVGCLGGHPNASTPNIDRLAKRGVLFTRAYCNAPVCNPSRASIWTGLRPTTTGITSNKSGWFRERPGFENVVTLPQALAGAGYATHGFGKLFHSGHGNRSDNEWQRFNVFEYGPRQEPKLNFPTGDRITDWGVPAGDDELAASFDPVIAGRVVGALQDKHERPFFLGCGFYRPHTPLYAAQKWFDQHPKEQIQLPPGYRKGDTDDLVYFGKGERREQDVEAPGLFSQAYVEETGKWKDILQAYLASTSSADHKLGRVLDAMDRHKRWQNTCVILFSDHGWHLGEKDHWGKAALWEQTTRVPFIIAGPNVPSGVRCDQPVDLLSIAPTVFDYAGVKPPHQLDGHSLRPILENPKRDWNHPVVTTFVDHHALRTKRWRYIRYASGEEELYDHGNDPKEFNNLAVTAADRPEIQATLKSLRAKLDAVLKPREHQKRKPVPVIFDTDITGDVDDVLALAMLHTMADRGLCEILAVTMSKENELAAPFVDAVNTFYGRPDIPIGIAEGAPPRDSRYLQLVNEKDGDAFRYPHDIGVTAEPEKAVPLIKRTLESAEDGSVAVIQVGLATNLAGLLATEGGNELISRKVDHLSVMAGGFETINGNNRYLEANVRNHVPSMQQLAAEWPNDVPVIWSGFSVGIAVPFPRESVANDFDYVAHHPVKEAYLLHSGPEHDRPTWDLTSVLYSVFPHRGYFDLSPAGRVSVDDKGFTLFEPAQGSRDWPKNTAGMPLEKMRDRYLQLSPVQAARVQEALVHFVVQPPRNLKRGATKPPVKLIFDTDMGNDVDDAMALAVIHSLEKRGACELLAVTSTKDHPKSAAFIDAVNTFYGRPGVPIGAVRDGAKPELGKYNGLAENYPHDLRSGEDAPEAVSLLREVLAAQPDRSVTIAQVGFFTNLARLLESKGDAHSPLDGVELVKKKVNQLVIMAGSFQTIRYNNGYREYNVWNDIPSAQNFARKWPSPIVWSGFEIGIAAAYPWQSVMEDFDYVDSHVIKEAYLAYAPRKPHDRPTWDLTAVLHGVYPGRGFFDLSPRGRVTVDDVGATIFQPVKQPNQGRDRFLIMDEIKTARVREALVQLTSEPPKK